MGVLWQHSLFFLKMKSLLIDVKKWKNIHFWEFWDRNKEFQGYSLCHLFYEYDGTCLVWDSAPSSVASLRSHFEELYSVLHQTTLDFRFSSTFCSLFAIFLDYLVVYCLRCLQCFCIYNIERDCKLLGQPDYQTCHISNLSVCVKLNL